MSAQDLLRRLHTTGVLLEAQAISEVGRSDEVDAEIHQRIAAARNIGVEELESELRKEGVLAPAQKMKDLVLPADLMLTRHVDLLGTVLDDDMAARLRDPDRFGFAVAATGQINAVAFCDSGDWVILFNQGLYSALYGTARTLCSRMQIGDEPELPCESCARPDCPQHSIAMTARRWIEYGLRAVLLGHCGSEDYAPTPRQLAFASRIATCAETFVIAHEVAHHVLGHTEEDATASFEGEDLAGFSPSQMMELQADTIAAQITVAAIAKERSAESMDDMIDVFLGIETFFLTVDLLHICSGTELVVMDSSHPSTAIRRAAVAEALAHENLEIDGAFEHFAGLLRRLAFDCMKALCEPTPHDFAVWAQEFAAAEAVVAVWETELLTPLTAERVQDLRDARWRCSQMFFDHALVNYLVAQMIGAGENAMRPLLHTVGSVVEYPPEVVRAVDPSQPGLGLRGALTLPDQETLEVAWRLPGG